MGRFSNKQKNLVLHPFEIETPAIGLQPIYNFSLDGVFPMTHVDGMKRSVQIATVALALSMLAGFVVYSQQKAGRPIGYLKIGPAGTITNVATSAAPHPAVAPGSKSLAPLVRPPATVVATNSLLATSALPVRVGAGFTIRSAPSSKSGLVFMPQQLLTLESPEVLHQLPAAVSSPPARYFVPTGQVMFSTKPAPVITPSTFPNQRSVVMRTNPPPRKPAP